MICPKCGSYQPDRAKYCGICGEGLSQDGLVESFLRSDAEHEIVLPRHRSFWFYTAVMAIVILALAIFAGAGYLVYRVAWGDSEPRGDGREFQDTSQEYTDQELGYTISYPENWSLETASPAEGELAALTISLSAQKNVELRVYQLDPLVSIGGIDAIEEHLAEDAAACIEALGGQPGSGGSSRPAGGQPGDSREPGSQPAAGDTAAHGEDETPNEATFKSTHVSGFPAFFTEFSTNIMGEETEFLLYYIVSGDYIFVFQARSPAGEYEDVRPQYFSITGSFKWERILDEQSPDETPGMSGAGAPVITFN